MSVAALLVSLSMLGVGAWLAVRLWGRGGADAFWVCVAAVALQIGIVAQFTSLAEKFTAAGVLSCQAALVVMLGAVARKQARGRPVGGQGIPRREEPPAWISASLAAIVIAVLVGSLTRQAVTPIWGWDECNYHAPRMLYWIQHRSILPYPTHNERQTLFPMGAELASAWPLLFVAREWPARLAFWLSLPLGAAGLWTVCRGLGLSRAASWAGAAIWVTTPAVIAHAESLKSDAWLGVYLLGAAYWLSSARSEGERGFARYVWAGVFIALAVNVKTTAAAVIPAAVVLAFVTAGDWRGRRWRLAGLTGGFTVAAVASGLVLVLGYTASRYGHPLGPADLRVLVRADPGWEVKGTNIARTLLFLVELPDLLGEELRAGLEHQGQRAAEAMGAMRTLRFEEGLKPPGKFEYRVFPTAMAYSLGGLLWVPALTLGTLRIVRLHVVRGRAISDVSVVVLMAGCQFAAVVLAMRWMGGGPNRFWLGAFAISMPVVAFFVVRVWEVVPRLRFLLCIGLVWALYPMVRVQVAATEVALLRPRDEVILNGQYAAIMPHIEQGARILLIAGNTTREWALFDPRGGFRNRVYSWAEAGFDPAGVAAMVDSHGITHVVVEGTGYLGPRFSGSVAVGPVLQALHLRGDLREVGSGGAWPRLWVRESGGVRE